MKTILNDELIKLLPNIFCKVLAVNYFDQSFIQKVKQNRDAVLVGITDEDPHPSDENNFDSLHHIRIGKDKLPFDNHSFTLILGENIFSDCFSLAQTINELHRVLIDDGVLITVEPNIQYYRHVLKLLQGKWDATLEEGKDKLHFFTPASLGALLNNSSFNVRVISPFETDSENSFPIETNGFVHINKYHIGPLTPEEYNLFIIKRFLVVASKINGGHVQ